MAIKRHSARLILILLILIIIPAFILLSLRNGEVDPVAWAVGGCLILLVVLQYNILNACFKNLDKFVLLAAQFLYSIGCIMLYRINPDVAIKQIIFIILGTGIAVIAIYVIRKQKGFGNWNWIFLGATILLLGSTLVLSRIVGGAKNWIVLAEGVQFQPSEFAKILFIVVSSYFFATRSKILSFIPYIGYAMICVALLIMATDLGTAMLFCLTFLIMFFAATNNKLLTLLGIGVMAGGAVASYKIFDHVRVRVQVWQDPWGQYHNKGYQIVQGLMALASGGLLGTGLGLGSPNAIPVASTDYIFAAICEEFGIIVGILLIGFYLVFIIRGILIALNARNIFDALLVFGCTSMLTIQSFIIIGGVIKLIPLTGITLPFVSAGGSSIFSSMIQLGIIEGVAHKNGQQDEKEVIEMGGTYL